MSYKLSAALAVILLTGCACAQAADVQERYTTKSVYGTVTSISGNDLTLQNTQNGQDFTVSLDSSVVIYENDDTIPPSQIQTNDVLLCTYTDGELTVIAVINPAS